MRAAAVLADVEIEVSSRAEQVLFSIIKEHSKAGASSTCASSSVCPSSACASLGFPPFDIIKIAGIEMAKKGLYAKVASQSSY